MSNKILLLEDDTLLAESIVDLLEEEGYTLLHTVNGEEALEATYKEDFDLYLIDINVPLIDGLTLIRELKEANDTTATIFLTSHKEKHKLKEAFLSGADDYITKPFDTEELLLRIQALLRRTQKEPLVQVGDFSIDEKQMLISFNDTPLELSKKEYDLLSLFLHNPNTVLPKEQIIETIWGIDESGSEGAIRVYINRLRQIVPTLTIQNIRGIGYKFVL